MEDQRLTKQTKNLSITQEKTFWFAFCCGFCIPAQSRYNFEFDGWKSNRIIYEFAAHNKQSPDESQRKYDNDDCHNGVQYCCMRFWCGANRSWSYKFKTFVDVSNTEVVSDFVATRQLRCCASGFNFCCKQQLDVYQQVVDNEKLLQSSPMYTILEDTCYCCRASYTIFDNSNTAKYKVRRPALCGLEQRFCGNCCGNFVIQDCSTEDCTEIKALTPETLQKVVNDNNFTIDIKDLSQNTKILPLVTSTVFFLNQIHYEPSVNCCNSTCIWCCNSND